MQLFNRGMDNHVAFHFILASEVAKSEDNQKRLVANISHDFRSPLTSMRGYLEAMLDGTIPPEMHEKYIGVVLNETNRLTKLTNSLLTLNNLSTKGMILDKSNFDINQVIKNTAVSFEGTCRERFISIELVLTGDTMYRPLNIQFHPRCPIEIHIESYRLHTVLSRG